MSDRFSLRGVLNVLFKHSRAIGLILALAMATAGSYLMLAPKEYSASTRVLVSIGREKFQQIEMQTGPLANLVFQERAQNVNNELEILRDPALLQRAFPALKARLLASPPAPAISPSDGIRGRLTELRRSGRVWLSDVRKGLSRMLVDAGVQSAVDPDTALAVSFYKALTLTAVKETDMIVTAFTWDDPAFAADALNIFLREYKLKRLHVFEAKESVNFFEDQLRSAEANSEAVEAEHTAFLRANGLSDFEVEKSQLLSQINSMRTELDAAKLEDENARMKLASVQRTYRADAGWIETAEASDAVTGTQALDQSFVQLLDQRTRLLARFQPGAAQIRDIDAQIARLRTQKFQSLSEFYKGRIAGIGEKLARIESGIATRTRSLRELTDRSITFNDIQRRRTAANNLLLEYRRKVEDLRVNNDLNSPSFSSVRVISEASPPILPSSPKTGIILALAAAFGLLAGISYAVVAELLSRTFNNLEQVEEILHIPLLASVPRLS